MSSYVLKAMKNIEHYDEIAQLYQQEEQDRIEGLKQIVEIQKKKDEEERARLEQEKEKEITERIAIAEASAMESGKQTGYNEGKQCGFTEGKEAGIEEGKYIGRCEGELSAYRNIAKQKAKQCFTFKVISLIIVFLGAVIFSVLVLTNVIDVSKWNLNDTQKWILGSLVPVVLSVGGTLLAIFIKTDEESIYKKLESKSSKDKA